jgi:hypothetical protein
MRYADGLRNNTRASSTVRSCVWKTTRSRLLRRCQAHANIAGRAGTAISSLVKEGTNKFLARKNKLTGDTPLRYAPRSLGSGSAALMAGAAGWPCDGPSPTQGEPGGVPVVPYPPRLLLTDAISVSAPWRRRNTAADACFLRDLAI